MMDELRKLQMTELEILDAVDKVCRKNNIHYSLYAGTLLGAERHKGFIPWDDDIDICMARDEYNRFIEVWNMESPEGYILQNKDNTPAFTQSFTKIRKDHTTFLQYDFERGRYHTGIFLDIFPIDRIPESGFAKKIFRFRIMLYQLMMREFVPENAGKIVRAGSKFLLTVIPKDTRKGIREKILKQIEKKDNDKSLKTVATETLVSINMIFPSDLTDAYTDIEFEDHNFMCFKKYKDMLKNKFGDYMQLPPESERVWKHHPIIIDFENNYEELVK